jgi:hypothetical protein
MQRVVEFEAIQCGCARAGRKPQARLGSRVATT